MNAIKHFTPRDATKTLPLVRRIVEDILVLANTMREIISSGSAESAQELEHLRLKMQDLFGELEELGCSYKDWSFDKGLVDFPSVINGEEVLLCWRSDEEELQYYHDYEAGFGGRQRIPQEYLEM